MADICVLDYGIGNLKSVSRSFEYHGADVIVTSKRESILSAKRLVIPGVGAFSDGMRELERLDLVSIIYEFVNTGKPVLGICLGMQLLFDKSEENGSHNGLGLISGKNIKIPETETNGHKRRRKVPHVGWKPLDIDINVKPTHPYFTGITDKNSFYFVHSYKAVPTDDECLVVETTYEDEKIVAFVAKKNIVGCQFHPEKSGPSGLALLKAFLKNGALK